MTAMDWRLADQFDNKLALAKLIQILAGQPRLPLAEADRCPSGVGVYILDYTNEAHPLYSALAEAQHPIYIGKAEPKGGRKGGVNGVHTAATQLRSRLGDHKKSILGVDNLSIDDFTYTYIRTDALGVRIAEALLIASLNPVWNKAVDGFGNNGVGGPRMGGKPSAWDTLHPGRPGRPQETDPAVVRAVEAKVTRFIRTGAC